MNSISRYLNMKDLSIGNSFRKSSSLLIPIFFCISITGGILSRWPLQNGDSASYVDFFSFKQPNDFLRSDMTLSVWPLLQFIQSGSQDFQQLLTNTNAGTSNFAWHAYVLTGLLSLLGVSNFSFFPSLIFFPVVLMSISFVVGLKLIFQYLASKLSFPQACIFVGILITNPIFFQSILGQTYIDRLFFGPAIYILIRIFDQKRLTLVDSLIAFITILISERTALYLGITIILSLVFFRFSELKSDRKVQVLAIVGLSGFCWFLFWNIHFATSDYYSAISLEGIISNFNSAMFGNRSPLLAELLLVLLPFLILISTNIYLSILSAALILPNIFFNIGGAELVGFYTHYHTGYSPLIFTLAAFGYVNLSCSTIFKAGSKRMFDAFIVSFVSIWILSYWQFSSPFTSLNSFVSNQIAAKSFDALGILPNDIRLTREQTAKDLQNLLTGITSKDALISMPEYLFPTAVSLGFSKVSYFPVDVGISQYVVAPYTPTSNDYPDVAIYGLTPESHRIPWGRELQKVLNTKYDLLSEGMAQGSKVIIYKLKKE
ncbi:hypothetical protein MCERE8_01384 [Candidatus Nanopelagicaceae bacterium]